MTRIAPQPEPLLTLERAARRLRISEEELLAAVRTGLVPAYRIGSKWRFKADELVWPPKPRPKPRRPRPPKQGWIYFIGAAAEYPIKIGWTVRVEGRIGSIQTGCWVPLVCHGAVRGTQAEEQAIHKRLAEHRTWGEWFERDVALAVLAELQADPEREAVAVVDLDGWREAFSVPTADPREVCAPSHTSGEGEADG